MMEPGVSAQNQTPQAAQSNQSAVRSNPSVDNDATAALRLSTLVQERNGLTQLVGEILNVPDLARALNQNSIGRNISNSSDFPLVPWGTREIIKLKPEFLQSIVSAYDKLGSEERYAVLSGLLRSESNSLALSQDPSRVGALGDAMQTRELREVLLARQAAEPRAGSPFVIVPNTDVMRANGKINDSKLYDGMGLSDRALQSAREAAWASNQITNPGAKRDIRFSALVQEVSLLARKEPTVEDARLIRDRRYELEGLATSFRENSAGIDSELRDRAFQGMRTQIFAALVAEARTFKSAGASREAIARTIPDMEKHYSEFVPAITPALVHYFNPDRLSFLNTRVAGFRATLSELADTGIPDTVIGAGSGAIAGGIVAGIAGGILGIEGGPPGVIAGAAIGAQRGAKAGAIVGATVGAPVVRMVNGGASRINDALTTGVPRRDGGVAVTMDALGASMSIFFATGGIARAGAASIISTGTRVELATLAGKLSTELERAGADIAEPEAARSVVRWLQSPEIQGEMRRTLGGVTEPVTGMTANFTTRLSQLVTSGATGVGPQQLEALYLLTRVNALDTATKAIGLGGMGLQLASTGALTAQSFAEIDKSNLTQGQKNELYENGAIALAKAAGGIALFRGAHTLIKQEMSAPLSNLRLGSPEELAMKQYTARAAALGISEQDAMALFPGIARDKATGTVDRYYQMRTVNRTILFVSATEGKATAFALDVPNLAGINSELGHERANELLRAIVQRTSKTLNDQGFGNVIFRERGPGKGGRFNGLVVGADQAAVDRAMRLAVEAVDADMQRRGLGSLPNPRGGEPGVRLNAATLPVRANTDPIVLFNELDNSVKPVVPPATGTRRAPTPTAGAPVIPTPEPTVPPVNTTANRPRLSDPWDAVVDGHRERIRGVTGREVGRADASRLLASEDAQRDGLTGLYNNRLRTPTIERARELGSGPNAVPFDYVELDVGNVQAVSALSKTAADNALRRAAKLFSDAMQRAAGTQGDSAEFRHGGDEFSGVIGNVPREVTRREMLAAQAEFNVYARNTRIRDASGNSIALADILHSKTGREPGVRFDFGITYLDPNKPLQVIFDSADGQITAARAAAVRPPVR